MLQSNTRQKRIKERYVGEAIDLVTDWRKHFQTRFRRGNGKLVKLTLDQAAEVVGVPRKTLEDYHYQLKKADTLIDVQSFRDEKMGFIRKLVKEEKQSQTQKDTTDKYFLNADEINIHADDSFEEAINQTPSMKYQFADIPQLLNDPQFVDAQYWREMMTTQRQETLYEMEMNLEDEDLCVQKQEE